MYESIEESHAVKIRKDRRCDDCERKFNKGIIMFTSVGKYDGDVSRIYECTDCRNWINNNPKIWRELCESECVFPGWIKDIEPLPDFLKI